MSYALITIVPLILMLVEAHPANAQERKTIKCESRGSQHEYCRTNTQGRVRLERQLSDAPCREYDTWGADRDGGGIWVARGCRGMFVVEPYSFGPSVNRPDRARTITCESRGGKSAYCRTNTRGRVRLVRQLSDSPCREYDTWGADRDGGGVWVDRGCRGEFAVEPFLPGRPGGQPGQGRVIRCESRGGKSQYCRTDTRGRVRLVRQLSDSPCRENNTWGAERDGTGIWVDRGCRGEFVVEQRRR